MSASAVGACTERGELPRHLGHNGSAPAEAEQVVRTPLSTALLTCDLVRIPLGDRIYRREWWLAPSSPGDSRAKNGWSGPNARASADSATTFSTNARYGVEWGLGSRRPQADDRPLRGTGRSIAAEEGTHATALNKVESGSVLPRDALHAGEELRGLE
jgi:hypothetical protein